MRSRYESQIAAARAKAVEERRKKAKHIMIITQSGQSTDFRPMFVRLCAAKICNFLLFIFLVTHLTDNLQAERPQQNTQTKSAAVYELWRYLYSER